MPTLAELARSNWILARLREPLGAGQDVFVKWSAMGAFNGAVLRRSIGATEVYFFDASRRQTWEPSDVVCELEGLVVVVRPIGWLPAPGLRSQIIEADAQFVPNSSSLSQVFRLMLSLTTTDPSGTTLAFRRLGDELGENELALEQAWFPPDLPEVDAELAFGKALPEQAVCDRLRAAFPGLPKCCLFGTGVVWSRGSGSASGFPGATRAVVFARQY